MSITKDDLDIFVLRVTDSIDKLGEKIDKVIQHNGTGLYDSAQVKQMLQISDATLWRYCKKGLKFYKSKQGRRLFAYQDIMDFIKGEL